MFQISMFVCNLLVPVLITVCGFMMYKRPPKEINDIYGYRTSMSKKNKETWKFAHDYCGRLWIKVGIIMLIVSIIIQIFFINSNNDTIGTMTCILCIIQTIILVITIIPVERALKQNFDKDGNKK